MVAVTAVAARTRAVAVDTIVAALWQPVAQQQRSVVVRLRTRRRDA